MKVTHLACAVVLALATAAHADDLKATARAVATKTQKAIVTAKLVLKISFGGREQEQKVEITGTVIDPSGLTVVSAAALDPASSLRGMMGRRGGGGGGGDQPRIESEVSETALVLEDGTEVEADVVLKDAELDLAFIRPRDSKTKFDYVELKARDAAPQLLDDVFVVSRLSHLANRSVAITTGTVKSVVKGPRTFIVCDEPVAMGNTGCLVYTADGAPLGLLVTKMRAGEGGGFRGRGEAAMAIVRPVADVLEIAKQAMTAKAPEKKKVEKSDKDDDDDAPKKAPEKKPSDKKKGDDF